MNLALNRIEMAVLVVNMAAMRKNLKRGFKSNYGKQEGKEILSHFDAAKEALEIGMEELDDDHQEKIIHFNVKELNTLNSFIPWYVKEMEMTFDAAKKKIKGENQKVIDTLKRVIAKIDQVKVDHA